MTNLIQSSHQKEIEYVAEIEEKTTKLAMTEELYNNVKLENDKLNEQNMDLTKQIDELLNISKDRKKEIKSLQSVCGDNQDHDKQCNEFMLSLFDHCYRSNNDQIKPPPINELRCFAQKTNAILSWLERHENKMNEKLLLQNEAITQSANRCNKFENESQELRTLTNSQKEHITKLEHDLILLSSNEEEMRRTMIQSQTEESELIKKYKAISQELDEKSLTLQRVLNQLQALQDANNDHSTQSQSNRIQLKQIQIELKEKMEECEAMHLNYIRIKMEHSQLKQEYDQLKAQHLFVTNNKDKEAETTNTV